MDPNSTPPAPPPITPGSNPYEFITRPQKPQKKLLIGNTKKEKLLVVIVGAVLLIMIISILIGIFSGGNSSKDDYQSLVQQQTELIRVSEIGVQKANQSDAQNLAITTDLALISQQPSLQKLAKKAGAKVDNKTLSLGKSSKTDTTLQQAAEANQFDSVFITTMQTNLKQYQQTLKKLYDASQNKTTKTALANAYNSVIQLLRADQASASDNPINQ